MASRRGAGEHAVASWNLATEVAGWVVLAGRRAGQLDPIGVAKLSGFETEILLAQVDSYVAVAAIDGTGAILATSTPVKI